MIWDRIEQNWDELSRRARLRWSRLSEHQLAGTGGKREQLARRIQETYGSTPAEAENQIKDWQASQQDSWRNG